MQGGESILYKAIGNHSDYGSSGNLQKTGHVVTYSRDRAEAQTKHATPAVSDHGAPSPPSAFADVTRSLHALEGVIKAYSHTFSAAHTVSAPVAEPRSAPPPPHPTTHQVHLLSDSPLLQSPTQPPQPRLAAQRSPRARISIQPSAMQTPQPQISLGRQPAPTTRSTTTTSANGPPNGRSRASTPPVLTSQGMTGVATPPPLTLPQSSLPRADLTRSAAGHLTQQITHATSKRLVTLPAAPPQIGTLFEADRDSIARPCMGKGLISDIPRPCTAIHPAVSAPARTVSQRSSSRSNSGRSMTLAVHAAAVNPATKTTHPGPASRVRSLTDVAHPESSVRQPRVEDADITPHATHATAAMAPFPEVEARCDAGLPAAARALPAAVHPPASCHYSSSAAAMLQYQQQPRHHRGVARPQELSQHALHSTADEGAGASASEAPATLFAGEHGPSLPADSIMPASTAADAAAVKACCAARAALAHSRRRQQQRQQQRQHSMRSMAAIAQPAPSSSPPPPPQPLDAAPQNEHTGHARFQHQPAACWVDSSEDAEAQLKGQVRAFWAEQRAARPQHEDRTQQPGPPLLGPLAALKDNVAALKPSTSTPPQPASETRAACCAPGARRLSLPDFGLSWQAGRGEVGDERTAWQEESSSLHTLARDARCAERRTGSSGRGRTDGSVAGIEGVLRGHAVEPCRKTEQLSPAAQWGCPGAAPAERAGVTRRDTQQGGRGGVCSSHAGGMGVAGVHACDMRVLRAEGGGGDVESAQRQRRHSLDSAVSRGWRLQEDGRVWAKAGTWSVAAAPQGAAAEAEAGRGVGVLAEPGVVGKLREGGGKVTESFEKVTRRGAGGGGKVRDNRNTNAQGAAAGDAPWALPETSGAKVAEVARGSVTGTGDSARSMHQDSVAMELTAVAEPEAVAEPDAAVAGGGLTCGNGTREHGGRGCVGGGKDARCEARSGGRSTPAQAGPNTGWHVQEERRKSTGSAARSTQQSLKEVAPGAGTLGSRSSQEARRRALDG
eukprot:jgi/Ulvmu1/3875/UM018_0095.1